MPASNLWLMYCRWYNCSFAVGGLSVSGIWQWEGPPKTAQWPFHILWKNLMIVDELKTKVIAFGCKDNMKVLFNGQQIETTSQYKYLENIISTTQTSRGDVFRENMNTYEHLCSQARKAIFGLKHRLKSLGALPPRVLMHMYETLIRPILMYGSDVWGSQPQGFWL